MTAFDNAELKDVAPVVALHSSASSSRQWKTLIGDLDGRHLVRAINLPGYGTQMQRDQSEPAMGRVARPVIVEIENLLEPVHLVGHSFGGGVALKVALLRPDLVKSLTLYEPVAFHLLMQGGGAEAALLKELKCIAEDLRPGGGVNAHTNGMKRFVNFWNTSDAWQGLSPSQHQHLLGLSSSVFQDFANALAESWRPDDVAALTMPCQILMGMESPIVAQRIASMVYELIGGAELVMLPGLGHMAPVTAPQWVNPRIMQHIARVERRASPCAWPFQSAA